VYLIYIVFYFLAALWELSESWVRDLNILLVVLKTKLVTDHVDPQTPSTVLTLQSVGGCRLSLLLTSSLGSFFNYHDLWV
jgi:hypothetical protein